MITSFSVIGLGSGGLLALIWVPIMLAMVGLRDLKAGAWSLGKRVGDMRVVDLKTAQRASNLQGFLRNSYYLVLVALMLIPIVKFLFTFLFVAFVVMDTLMVLTSPVGRRFGDIIAGTQVVPMAARETP